MFKFILEVNSCITVNYLVFLFPFGIIFESFYVIDEALVENDFLGNRNETWFKYE